MNVYKKFDRKLFEFLQPVFPKMKLREFQGSKKGNIVHISFIFPLKAEWISEITEVEENEREAYFIDEGRQLPPGIRTWKHKHIVRKTGKNSCEIIDDITYTSSNKLVEFFMYLPLFFSFYPRKNGYRNYFKKE